MGVPIKFESPRRSAREELLERLEQAPATHAEALLAVYDLLRGSILNRFGIWVGTRKMVAHSANY